MYLSRNKKYSNIISFLIFDRDIYIKIYSVSAKVCTKRIPILQLFYFTFFIIYNEEDFFLNYHSKFDERTSCKKRKNFTMIQVSIFPSIIIQIYEEDFLNCHLKLDERTKIFIRTCIYSFLIWQFVFTREIYIKIYRTSITFTSSFVTYEEDFFKLNHSKLDERTSCKKRKNLTMIQVLRTDFFKHHNTNIRRRFF